MVFPALGLSFLCTNSDPVLYFLDSPNIGFRYIWQKRSKVYNKIVAMKNLEQLEKAPVETEPASDTDGYEKK